MEWSDALMVGIGSIDIQHRRLVDLVNALYAALRSGHGSEALGTILDELITYTVEHFGFEERLFAQTAYADTAAHVREHEDLKRQVVEVQHAFRSGAVDTLSIEVLNFLKNWLVGHIQGTDRRYTPHLLAAGVT